VLIGKEQEQLIFEIVVNTVSFAWYRYSFALAGGCLLLNELLDAVISDILYRRKTRSI
jgi:hypothetical protein